MGRPKKVNRFQVRKFKNASGTTSYRVTGQKVDGKRTRLNFLTKLEAEQKRAELEAEAAGLPASVQLKRTRLSDDQLADAEAAVQSAGDRKLAEIVAHYLSIESRLSSRDIDIDAAVSFTESHYRKEVESISILNAQREFIQSRAGKQKRTIASYESTLRLLQKPDPNKLLHSFTVADLEKVLNRYKNVNTRRTHRAALGVFFNWALRHHYCLEDPCKRLDKIPKDMSQIATLSLQEAKRLLYAATLYHGGSAAPSVAIGLFAGLRPSEIVDLKPADITSRGIRVSGGKLRRQLKRTVPIPGVLDAWLKKYPFEGLPKGWDYKLRKLKGATRAEKWIQDIIRHTSITYQTERDKNEALTAFNCGTSIEMMNRHYRDSIDDEGAVSEFWRLTPAKIRTEKPEVVMPSTKKVPWPPKAKLKKLVWQKPLVHAASEIGVSNVALKKRCVKLGIDLPPRGHWLRQ